MRVRVANDLQTIFHEVGHYLDRVALGINRKDKRWRDELKDLGQATSRPSYTIRSSAKRARRSSSASISSTGRKRSGSRRTTSPRSRRRLDTHPEVAAVICDVQQRVRGYLVAGPGDARRA